jgi:replicative DNA helicase
MAEAKIKPQGAGYHREPPHSVESELALIGSIMLRPSSLDKVIDVLSPSDFYRSAHRLVYEAMLELNTKRDAIDVVTLAERLEKTGKLDSAGGVEFLTELTEAVPTSHNIENYGRIIADKAILRGLVDAAWEILEDGYSSSLDVREIIDEAERKVFEVGQREVTPSLAPIDQIVMQSLKEIDEHLKKGAGFTGIPTGYEKLDELTNGLQRGELIVIAARPSMGKSAFALNIAENIALRDNIPVVVFTLEMSKEQCGLRFLSSQGRVNLQRLYAGDSDAEDFQRLTRAAGALDKAPIYIDDSGYISTDEIRAKCRRLKAEKGLGLIVIDYIQLMKTRKGIESREQQISDISRSLKGMAKELDVPVLALSQLNRKVEDRPDKRPHLSDIRESGAVEQDADLIAFIYRHEYYNPDDIESKGKAEVIVAKHRQGPTGKVELTFLGEFIRFENLELGRDDPY